MLASRLEQRLASHRADLAALRGAREPGPLDARHLLGATVNDVTEGVTLAKALGPSCYAEPPSMATCRTPVPADVVDNPDEALAHLSVISAGFQGRGGCAPSSNKVPASSPCRAINTWLQTDADQQDLARVREGWGHPWDGNGQPGKHAALAAMEMGRWRAIIDYGLALAPLCTRRPLRGPCDDLRRGLAEAEPDELLGRLHTLRAVYAGAACPVVDR